MTVAYFLTMVATELEQGQPDDARRLHLSKLALDYATIAMYAESRMSECDSD